MTTPITIGWPQAILLLFFIVGIGLLISAGMGLARPVRRVYIDEEGRKVFRHHRHVRWGRGLSAVLLLAVAISVLWATSLVQTYVNLTADIPVAQVHATPIDGEPHLMSVEMTLYDKDGHTNAHKTFLVHGDEWMLQGNIVKFPAWLNVLGLHSGYKLTRLQGRYDDPNLELTAKRSVITLNGGDDNFFKTVQQQAWMSPFVEAAYGNAVFLGADGKTYNVLVSQSGLYAKPAR